MNGRYVDPHINGWMTENELQFIYALAGVSNTIVEIGSWEGKSTHALLSGCKGQVYAVDHFHGSPAERETSHKKATQESIKDIFLKNCGGFDNLHVLEMDSVEASKQFDDLSVDFIFVDGAHDYESVTNDLKAWFPKCKRIFAGHDIDEAGVPKALLDFGRPVLQTIDRIWVML